MRWDFVFKNLFLSNALRIPFASTFVAQKNYKMKKKLKNKNMCT